MKIGRTFQGKVALVTGSASGIGRATAIAFGERGAKVVVGDIDEVHGRETVRMIEQAGSEGLFVKADVTKAAEVEKLIARGVQEFGRLDFAHNNAGIMTIGPFVESTEEQWDRLMNINLKGVWLCMKYELIQMTAQGSGVIINTSSLSGLIVVRPGASLYNTSKWGINGLTKSAAVEYAKAGIRVNAVCPGGVESTGIFQNLLSKSPGFEFRFSSDIPFGRRDTTPKDVSEAVVWLCSDSASYITGVMIPIDGGISAI
jgi:NAD(P)-dependent dehydrogenase (short-subunit alcohol dehydrogenase family)